VGSKANFAANSVVSASAASLLLSAAQGTIGLACRADQENRSLRRAHDLIGNASDHPCGPAMAACGHHENGTWRFGQDGPDVVGGRARRDGGLDGAMGPAEVGHLIAEVGPQLEPVGVGPMEGDHPQWNTEGLRHGGCRPHRPGRLDGSVDGNDHFAVHRYTSSAGASAEAHAAMVRRRWRREQGPKSSPAAGGT
jgi:hypothetical protein